MATKQRKTTAVEKKLIGLADVVIAAADRSMDRRLRFRFEPCRMSRSTRARADRDGSKKQARSFFNVGMAKKFMQTVLVADALSELQRADLTTSLRKFITARNTPSRTLTRTPSTRRTNPIR